MDLDSNLTMSPPERLFDPDRADASAHLFRVSMQRRGGWRVIDAPAQGVSTLVRRGATARDPHRSGRDAGLTTHRHTCIAR